MFRFYFVLIFCSTLPEACLWEGWAENGKIKIKLKKYECTTKHAQATYTHGLILH